jgi:hypothetical protein
MKHLQWLPTQLEHLPEDQFMVWADTLQEAGDLQGELMSLAHRYTQTKRTERIRVRRAMRNLETTMAEQLAEQWGIQQVCLVSGLVVGLEVDMRNAQSRALFQESPEQIRKRWPCLSHMTITNVRSRRFSLRSLKAWMEQPFWMCITKLNLSGNTIDDNFGNILANSPSLTNLCELDLSTNNLTIQSMDAMAHSAFLSNIQALNISANPLEPDGIDGELPFASFRQLQTLQLNNTAIGDDVLSELANSSNLTSLRSLELGENWVSDLGVQDLASSPVFAQLQSLNLSRTEVGDDGALALAQSKYLRNLRSLNVRNTFLSAQGRFALKHSPSLKNTDVLIDQLEADSNEDKFEYQDFFEELNLATTSTTTSPLW